MLIFDTNAVKDLDPHGTKADLLRLLSKAGMEIGAPWAVVEELVAHKLYDYQRAFDLMRRQHQALGALEPNLAGPVPEFQESVFADHWRKQYSEIFTIIPTSEAALQAAVLREAACMKPAKVEVNNKSGGRDVAIWFSILEFLEGDSNREVHFISANTKDFGDPGEWPFPLDLDLGENAQRLTHVLTFEEILEKFSEPSEIPEGVSGTLMNRLKAPEVAGIIGRELWGRHLRRVFGSKSKQLPARMHLGLEPQISDLVECRRIGESTWYWSKVSWQVFALRGGSTDPFLAAWDTTIIFPEDDNGEISLLRGGRLIEVALEDMSETLRDNLSAVVQHEVARLDDVVYQPPGEVHHDLSEEDASSPVLRHSINALKSRARAENVAFEYEKRVLGALLQVNGNVRYVGGSGDLGIDAIAEVPEGTIGIRVKHGLRLGGMGEIMKRVRVSNEIADAILTITSHPMSQNTELAMQLRNLDHRPHEVVCWAGDLDNDVLAKSIRSLRHRLRGV